KNLTLIPKHGAVHAILPGSVNELSPNKQSIPAPSNQHQFLAWTYKQLALPTISVLVCAVVPLVKCESRLVSVPRGKPMLGNAGEVYALCLGTAHHSSPPELAGASFLFAAQ